MRLTVNQFENILKHVNHAIVNSRLHDIHVVSEENGLHAGKKFLEISDRDEILLDDITEIKMKKSGKIRVDYKDNANSCTRVLSITPLAAIPREILVDLPGVKVVQEPLSAAALVNLITTAVHGQNQFDMVIGKYMVDGKIDNRDKEPGFREPEITIHMRLRCWRQQAKSTLEVLDKALDPDGDIFKAAKHIELMVSDETITINII